MCEVFLTGIERTSDRYSFFAGKFINEKALTRSCHSYDEDHTGVLIRWKLNRHVCECVWTIVFLYRNGKFEIEKQHKPSVLRIPRP
jgi:hypothetical protein